MSVATQKNRAQTEMSNSELSSWCRPQVNIVLLGGRNSGKSSLGNMILGKEEFATRERTSCSRRVGLVSGRWLTVVDTPGWWCDFSSRDTSELVKREIRSSVFLCPPGPHAFLVAVKANSGFSERRRRAVEEHVALLGEGVWDYCVVVFTSEVRAAQTTEEGQTGLRWLADKCGHRCRAVGSGGGGDVAQLLEEILKLVRENGNRAFEMERPVVQATVQENRRVEEEALRRFLRVKKQRSLAREKLRHVTDIRIVLLGAKGSGKTSTLNTILDRPGGQVLGRTAQCMMGRGLVFGRQLTVVDTPGWWMNYFGDETSIFDRDQLILSLSLCPPGPHVFLLTVRVDRAFTETYRRAVQEHLQLLGQLVWTRVILVFTFGDWLGGTTIEQCIESEGPPLTWLVESCGNRYHVVNNQTTGDGFQVRELILRIEEMLAGCADGRHSGVSREVMEQMEEKMRREEERAEERRKRKERQRQAGKLRLAELKPLPELRVVLVGGRKTGKSSCGNTILSRRSFCTNGPTTSCKEDTAQVFGRSVSVLDTPGCFSLTSDLLEPASVLLLVVNVSSSFGDSQEEALGKQLEAGGARVWSRTMVLFSHGDWLGPTGVERRIESEGAALQRLVEKCGNRYHVLDNKGRGNGAQVEELMELIEETLLEERLDAADHVWRSVCAAAAAAGPPTVTLQETSFRSHRHQLPQNSTGRAASSAALTPATRSDTGGPMPPLPPGAAGHTGLPSVVDVTSCLACVPSSNRCRLRWTLKLPVCFSADDLHLRTNGESLPSHFSSRRPRPLLALPPTQFRMFAEDDSAGVRALCHPALRERTLLRLSRSGGLQALIDRWDHSNLEELEAFIDLYFEMVWEQSRAFPEFPEPEEQLVVKETGEADVLASIDRKLSKLELLEDIQKELKELRTKLEHSWKLTQEEKHDNNT